MYNHSHIHDSAFWYGSESQLGVHIFRYICIYICIYVSVYVCTTTLTCMSLCFDTENKLLGTCMRILIYTYAYSHPQEAVCPRLRFDHHSKTSLSVEPSRWWYVHTKQHRMYAHGTHIHVWVLKCTWMHIHTHRKLCALDFDLTITQKQTFVWNNTDEGRFLLTEKCIGNMRTIVLCMEAYERSDTEMTRKQSLCMFVCVLCNLTHLHQAGPV